MLYLTYTISVNDDKTLCKNLSNLLFSVKGHMYSQIISFKYLLLALWATSLQIQQAKLPVVQKLSSPSSCLTPWGTQHSEIKEGNYPQPPPPRAATLLLFTPAN